MATITETSTYDILDKYTALVRESLSTDSAYIRAKETINDLVADGSIDESQKAEILSNIISSIANTITTSSMQAALSWAQSEKEFAFKKLSQEKELDVFTREIALKTAQAEEVNNKIRLAKVESKRVYGTATFDADNNILSLDNTGKVYRDMELVDEQISKTSAETALTSQKLNESYAAVHKIVADTYVNYGSYTYSGLSTTGLSTVTAQHGSFVTLSDTQQDIAKEQAKGYTYNAWANALTGSASMLGTAMAAEYAEFGTGTTGGQLLDIIKTTATSLQNATTPP